MKQSKYSTPQSLSNSYRKKSSPQPSKPLNTPVSKGTSFHPKISSTKNIDEYGSDNFFLKRGVINDDLKRPSRTPSPGNPKNKIKRKNSKSKSNSSYAYNPQDYQPPIYPNPKDMGVEYLNQSVSKNSSFSPQTTEKSKIRESYISDRGVPAREVSNLINSLFASISKRTDIVSLQEVIHSFQSSGNSLNSISSTIDIFVDAYNALKAKDLYLEDHFESVSQNCRSEDSIDEEMYMFPEPGRCPAPAEAMLASDTSSQEPHPCFKIIENETDPIITHPVSLPSSVTNASKSIKDSFEMVRSPSSAFEKEDGHSEFTSYSYNENF